MKGVKVYKLDMAKDASSEGILVDFYMNDLCDSHKYFLINYNGDVNVKKINSIDMLVEYLDRNNFSTTELSNQSISSLASTMEYYLKNDNVDNSLCNVPGTAPLSDFDKKFLKTCNNKIIQSLKWENNANIPNNVFYTGGDYHGKK